MVHVFNPGFSQNYVKEFELRLGFYPFVTCLTIKDQQYYMVNIHVGKTLEAQSFNVIGDHLNFSFVSKFQRFDFRKIKGDQDCFEVIFGGKPAWITRTGNEGLAALLMEYKKIQQNR